MRLDALESRVSDTCAGVHANTQELKAISARQSRSSDLPCASPCSPLPAAPTSKDLLKRLNRGRLMRGDDEDDGEEPSRRVSKPITSLVARVLQEVPDPSARPAHRTAETAGQNPMPAGSASCPRPAAGVRQCHMPNATRRSPPSGMRQASGWPSTGERGRACALDAFTTGAARLRTCPLRTWSAG